MAAWRERKAGRCFSGASLLFILAFFPSLVYALSENHFPDPQVTIGSADFLINLKIYGVSAAPGDEVAFFDPQGALCGRHLVSSTDRAYFPVVVYGDDTTTVPDEGAGTGEILTVKIWQAAAGLELTGNDLVLSQGAAQSSYYIPSAIPPVWQENTGSVLNIDTATHYPQPAPTLRVANYIGNLNINGTPASVGDELAAYDVDSVLCGSSRITTTGKFAIAIYGDDSTTATIDEGPLPGETIIFKVWDHLAGQEYTEANMSLAPGAAQGSFYVPSASPPIWSEDQGYVLNMDTGLTEQSISFAALPAATYGDAPLVLHATGGASGNPILFASANESVAVVSGATLTIVGTGQTLITAAQAGNAQYASAKATQLLTIAKPSLTVKANDVTKTYDGLPFANGNGVNYAGFVNGENETLITGALTYGGSAQGAKNTGTYDITPGGLTAANYNIIFATGTLTITKAPQRVTVEAVGEKKLGDPPFSLISTGGGSGNPIIFSLISGRALLNGAEISMTGVGTVTIRASQAGNDNFTAGETTYSFEVLPGDTLPDFAEISTLTDGATTANQVLNVAGRLTNTARVTSFTINGKPVTIYSDGSFSHAVLLTEGSNPINLRVTNAAGNGNSNVRTITLDASAPAMTISVPADNSVFNRSFVGISWTLAPQATSEITMNGVKPQSISLSPGMNTLQITATDALGKTNSLKRTIYYDRSMLPLAITNPVQDVLVSKTAYLLKGNVGSALPPIQLVIRMAGKTYTPALDGTGNFEQELSLTEQKTYTIEITVTDSFGRSSTVRRNIIYREPAITNIPGDMNNDRLIDMADVIMVLQLTAGLRPVTPDLILRGDVAPLMNGQPTPDGVLDMADLLVILRILAGNVY